MNARGAEAVVVGAGVVGASVAYNLARAGLRVIVVDRRGIAAGATGVSAGFIRSFHPGQPALTALAVDSWPDLAGWEDVVGGSIGFVRTGCLHRIPTTTDESSLPQAVMDASTLRASFPQLCWPDDARAIYEQNAGYAAPWRCAEAYLRGVIAAGGSVWTGAACLGLRADDDGISGVVTSAGVLTTSIVIVATGAWSENSALIHTDAPLRTKRIVTQSVAVPPKLTELPAYVDEGVDSLFFRPNGTSELLVGGGPGTWDEHPDDRPGTPSGTGLGHVRYRLEKLLGVPASQLEVVSGLDAYTPDELPIIDRYPEIDGVWVATAFSGKGFKVAPAVGRALSRWIVTGVEDEILQPFSVGRFRFERADHGDRRSLKSDP